MILMRCFMIAVALAFPLSVVCGDDDPNVERARDVSQEKESVARLKRMREIVRGLKLQSGGGDRTILKLATEPLLRYSDPPHLALEDATVWLWRHGDRPAAILKLEFYPRHDGGPIWSFCWTSVSNEPIDGRFEGGKSWSPPPANVTPAWVPDAPSPAADASRRLRQMGQIARRFTSHRIYDDERTELRLLSRPLYRYTCEADGIVDGAVFGIAKDTNPHVELLLEAALDDGLPRWRYYCVRHADAECRLRLDGREVWLAPRRAATDPRQPYFWFQTPVDKE